MSDRIKSGETERIEILALDSAKAGVTGLTCTVALRRSSDGNYWNGSAWQAGATTANMTETDSSNRPGLYHYAFTPTGTGFAVFIYVTTASATVVNKPWTGQVFVGGYADNIDATISGIAATILATVAESQGSITVNQILQTLLAACAGVTTTGGTIFKTPNGSATRITAAVNSSNERTSITLTP